MKLQSFYTKKGNMHKSFIGVVTLIFILSSCGMDKKTIKTNDAPATVTLDTLPSLNITFKNEPYYWPRSQNPYRVSQDWTATDKFISRFRLVTHAPKNAVTLEVDTTLTVAWMEEYGGYKMYLHNNTLDTLYFTAQDARMYIFIQALDTLGDWHHIEQMKPSWCGVSYQIFCMPPVSNFDFVVPKYEGTYKTKLRAFGVYSIKKYPDNNSDFRYLYSNEWVGSINPEQFCRLPELEEVSALLPWRKYQK